MYNKEWTQKEIEYINEVYGYKSGYEIAEVLNRTYSAVNTKIKKMGIKKANRYHTYIIYFPELDLYKLGYSKNPKIKAKSFNEKFEIIFTRVFNTKKEALLLERHWKRNIQNITVNLGLFPDNGDSEIFDIDKLNQIKKIC